MRNLLASILVRSGFASAYGEIRRRITGSQVAILIYHRVSEHRNSWPLNHLEWHAFKAQIEFLSRNYKIISLENLASSLQQNILPQKAAVITFDDGYKDNYTYAFPILKKYNAPATIFLTTGHIGSPDLLWFDKVGYIIWHTPLETLSLEGYGDFRLNSQYDRSRARSSIINQMKALPEEARNLQIQQLLTICGVEIPAEIGREVMLSWDEVGQMHRSGISFGAHTLHHTILTNMTMEQAKREILQSKKDIEERTGIPVTAFSYPDGSLTSEIAEMVRDSGFACAVSGHPFTKHVLIGKSADVFSLSRLGTADLNRSRLMLSGMVGDIENLFSLGRSR